LEIAAAVIGGVIVSLLVTFTTSLTHVQLILAYIGIIAVCILLVAGLQLLSVLLRRRREKFKAEVIAAAKEALLEELASRAPEPHHRSSPRAILRAVQASAQAEDLATLRSLLLDGRMVQARLRESGYSNLELQGELAVAIGQWEGRAATALVSRSDQLREFRNAPGDPQTGLSIYEAYRRTEHQLEVLEEAIQEFQTRRVQPSEP
jgi:hypothetical protein